MIDPAAYAFIEKASRAAMSAKVLLNDGDIDGACSRAYYAMFDAAKSALIASKSPVSVDDVKSHGGIIAMFGLHLVKTGDISKHLGHLLNRAQELRTISDYKTKESVNVAQALEMANGAETFVAEIRAKYFSEPKDTDGFQKP